MDGLGCVQCIPGTGSCRDGMARVCLEDGSGFTSFVCDPVQGMECASDGCRGHCVANKLGRSHVGCDFWPTVTANAVQQEGFEFGVLVTNTTEEVAEVRVTSGEIVLAKRKIAPNGQETIVLPWVKSLKGPDAPWDIAAGKKFSSVLSASRNTGNPGTGKIEGAYRLRSNRPVVVMQFNSLQAVSANPHMGKCSMTDRRGRCLSLSNDASLLLPSTSWDKSFSLMGWKASYPVNGYGLETGDFVSVSASMDGTKVAIRPLVKVWGLGGKLEPGRVHNYELAAGDVLQLFTDSAAEQAQWAGSSIESNQPVQVITGSPCASVPLDARDCDHLEETNVSTRMLASRYVVTLPEVPGGRSHYVLRAHGIKDATIITFDPPDVLKPVTVKKGESLDIVVPYASRMPTAFIVSSNRPFGLTQYLTGNAFGAPTGPGFANYGDPSQTVVVPVSRYLRHYVFAVPQGFARNRVDVVASTGSEVFFNNELVPLQEFEAVGASGLSVARLKAAAGARVELRCEQPMGVQMYGFGLQTSYVVPGGIDLRAGLEEP